MGLLGWVLRKVWSSVTKDDDQKTYFKSAIGAGRMSKKEKPPNEPGIYRWIHNETDSVEYVGATNDLSRRKKEHERSGKYPEHTFSWKKKSQESSIEDLYQAERKHIEKHKPTGNVKKGGNGRRPKNQ